MAKEFMGNQLMSILKKMLIFKPKKNLSSSSFCIDIYRTFGALVIEIKFQATSQTAIVELPLGTSGGELVSKVA